MKLSKYEEETVVLYNKAEATASVYTHDSKLKAKLIRLSEKYPDKIVFNTENSSGGVTYTVPKRCVLIKEPYSEERRKAASERAKTAGYRPPKHGKVSDK